MRRCREAAGTRVGLSDLGLNLIHVLTGGGSNPFAAGESTSETLNSVDHTCEELSCLDWKVTAQGPF